MGFKQCVRWETCNKGIPSSSASGDARCLEHEAAQLADLEHQAGPHLCLGEHLNPNHIHPVCNNDDSNSNNDNNNNHNDNNNDVDNNSKIMMIMTTTTTTTITTNIIIQLGMRQLRPCQQTSGLTLCLCLPARQQYPNTTNVKQVHTAYCSFGVCCLLSMTMAYLRSKVCGIYNLQYADVP